MSQSQPPVPPEQRSPGPAASAGQDTNTEGARAGTDAESLKDRRDQATSVQDGQPGDAGVNADQQGRFGDIAQNTTHQGHQQDR